MKNQYFGDENDYRKYGLLRILASKLSIGVCWMLTNGDVTQDGKFIQYLKAPAEWEHYDPKLFAKLRESVIRLRRRAVVEAERTGLIPHATYFDSLLADAGEDRRTYFAAMRQRFRRADLVFFDPDNGLEVKSVRYGCKRSSKYLYWSELINAFKGGRSVLVYQHFPRIKREIFVPSMRAEVQRRTKAKATWAFRTSRVLFLLAAQPVHLNRLRLAVSEIRTRWSDQVDVVSA